MDKAAAYYQFIGIRQENPQAFRVELHSLLNRTTILSPRRTVTKSLAHEKIGMKFALFRLFSDILFFLVFLFLCTSGTASTALSISGPPQPRGFTSPKCFYEPVGVSSTDAFPFIISGSGEERP